MPRESVLRTLWKRPAFWSAVAVVLVLVLSAVQFALIWQMSGRLAEVERTVQLRGPVTSTAPTIQIVPVERVTVPISIPDALKRQPSPVVRLLRSAKAGDDGMVSVDREIGSAVAMTRDGWVATTWTAVSGMRIADLEVAWGGQAYPVARAIRDLATDVVYVKFEGTDLPPTALGKSGDVLDGEAVWVEPRGGQLYPETVMDTRLRAGTEPASSERASRRFLVSGGAESGWNGAAVWGSDGNLIGMIEGHVSGGWQVVPAGDMQNALASVLGGRDITHAVLGVRGYDLPLVTFDVNVTSTVPSQGTWIKRDRRQNLPAVSVSGPAAKWIRENDVLENVEHDILDGSADLGEILLAYKPGSTVQISGRRDAQPFQVSVTLGSQVTSEIIK